MRKEGTRIPATTEDAVSTVKDAECPDCGTRMEVRNQGQSPEIVCTKCGNRIILGTIEVKFQVAKSQYGH